MSEFNFPIQIDSYIFYKNHFIVGGSIPKQYNISDIKSLKFNIQSNSINFSKEEIYYFCMEMEDNEAFSIEIGDGLFTITKRRQNKKKRALLYIYNHINKATYQRRLNRYLLQMQDKGYFTYPFVDSKLTYQIAKISLDGLLSFDDQVIDLRKANREGTLKFGTQYGLGADVYENPYQVSINEKKPILGGLIEGKGSLRIDGSWDFPILFDMIKSVL